MGAIDGYLKTALSFIESAKKELLADIEAPSILFQNGTVVEDPSDRHLYNLAPKETSNPISDLVSEKERLEQIMYGLYHDDPGKVKLREEIKQLNEQIKDEIQKDYEARWDTIGLDEKKAILQEVHNQIAAEFGMDPIEIQFKDIEDPEGLDRRGHLKLGSNGLPIIGGFIDPFDSDTEIVIDIDNLTSDEYTTLMTTTAHETRHQYQEYLVNNPDEIPSHISQEEVDSWGENFDNYISAKDDYAGYLAQPVEADAIDYADTYVDGFYETEAENYE